MADRQARIKCGHCKGRHVTTAQVALCGHRARCRAALQAAADRDAQAEVDADARYERYLEEGGAARERIAYEHEQDRLRESGMLPPW